MNPDYHQRELFNTRNLDYLVVWLEYGKTSTYRASRCSKEQEEYWAMLLREVLEKIRRHEIHSQI